MAYDDETDQDELDKIATYNPDPTERAIDRVNTAAKKVDSTSATDLSIAAAMDRADLGNRFGFGSRQYLQGTERPVTSATEGTIGDIYSAIDRRRELIQQGVDPERPALYMSPKRQGELLHLNALDAEVAHRQYQDMEHARVMRDTAQFHKGLAELPFARGTEDRYNGVLDLAQKFPGAYESEAGQNTLRRESALQKQAETVNEHRKMQAEKDAEHRKIIGYRNRVEQAKGIATKLGEPLTLDPETGEPDIEGMKRAAIANGKNPDALLIRKPGTPEIEKRYPGLTESDIAHPVSAAVGDVIKSKTEGVEFKGNSAGTHVRIYDTKGKPHYLTVEDYKGFGGKLSAEDEKARIGTAPTPTATATPTPATKKKFVFNPATGQLE